MTRQLLTEQEAAQAFGVCKKTFVRRVVRTGKLDFILIGRSRYYDPEDIQAYKQGAKRRWPSENGKAHHTTSTISRSGVVDIEDLRARRHVQRR